MHFYCCNDAVPWLNGAKSRIFRCTVIVKYFQIHLYFVCHLPSATCRKTRFRYVYWSNFSHKECNWRLQYESLVPKKIYPLHPDDSLHPSLAFIVLLQGEQCAKEGVNNSWPLLNKCEHMNLRGESTRAVFEELYYTANNQKIADNKKAGYQEGLEKSSADSAARSRDSYMKDPENSCA